MIVGFILGLFVGSVAGLFTAGLCMVAREGDDEEQEQQKTKDTGTLS